MVGLRKAMQADIVKKSVDGLPRSDVEHTGHCVQGAEQDAGLQGL